MNSNSPVQLVPTYCGFIESTYDALVLFEACLTGLISHVPRRPHDREREHVIKSGNIFIYEESTSGIKRWTDGISWSPSRILGNFLIYRQLQKPFGPGEKKKALKKPKGNNGVTKGNNQSNNGRSKASLMQVYNNPNGSNGAYGEAGKMNPDIERALIGSLVDSYDFMDDGLVKKTISVVVNGITHHLVSYYTLADAAARKFQVPTKNPKFLNLDPRPALLNKQSFRGPVDEVDPLDRMVYGRNRYDMTNQSMTGQSVSYMPTQDQTFSYGPSRSIYGGSYNISTTTSSYDHSPIAYSSAPIYGSQFAPSPGIYPAPHSFPGHESYSAQNQRYSIASSASSDGSRVQMPAAADRRSSSFQHQGSQDSGISVATNMQGGTDSSYYQRPRETSIHNSSIIGGINAPPTQRSLPSLPPQNNETFRSAVSTYDAKPLAANHYEMKPVSANHYDMAMESKSPMWHMAGNTAVGHGHYQQAWPAAAGH